MKIKKRRSLKKSLRVEYGHYAVGFHDGIIYHPLDTTSILWFGGNSSSGLHLSKNPQLKNCRCVEVSLWSDYGYYFPRDDTDHVLVGKIFLRVLEMLARPRHTFLFSFEAMDRKTEDPKTGKYIAQRERNSVRKFLEKYTPEYLKLREERTRITRFQGKHVRYQENALYVFEFPRNLFQSVLALHWDEAGIQGYVIEEQHRKDLIRCLTSLRFPKNLVTLIKIARFVFEVANDGATLLVFSEKLNLEDFVPVVKDKHIREILQDWSD